MKKKQAKLSNLKPKQRAFLAAYSVSGVIAVAARAAKVPRVMHYMWHRDNKDYRLAFQDAKGEAIDALEEEARRRAKDGVRRVKFYKGTPLMIPAFNEAGEMIKDAKGEIVMFPYYEHEYSDRLLEFILTAARPKKFKHRESVEHSGRVEYVHDGNSAIPTPEELKADRNLDWLLGKRNEPSSRHANGKNGNGRN